jgi:hypothetical protein
MTARIATSWFGLAVGYLAAFSGAVLAFQKLEEPLKDWPRWVRLGLVISPLVLAFFVHTLPALLDSYRRRRLGEIKGELKPGYFRLSPRKEVQGFSRLDNKHQEILEWLTKPQSSVMYLTGLSGSGKSSLLTAWVIPKLEEQDSPVLTLQVRGFQDPAAQLEREIRTRGIIWQRPPAGDSNLRSLLERACKQIKPLRLLIVFDQFEEFVVLQNHSDQERFESWLNSIVQDPIDGLTVLLVLRSDYVGMLEDLNVPKLVQMRNWKDVPPFTESAAYRFIAGSGLTFADELLKKVLQEAAEVEETKGLIRPVTINLCGLVLERFHDRLPRGFRPGTLLRGFLQETVFLSKIREISPKILPLLVSGNLTKRPRAITDLAREAMLPENVVRGCLRMLGMPDRGIVRPIDEREETWEIAHDFLVPLLDSILTRRQISFWRRLRPWMPWLSAATLLISASVFYGIAVREEAISKQVERSLHPIANVQVEYSLLLPIGESDMRSYRDRLMTGARVVSKQPGFQGTKHGYVSARNAAGVPSHIAIPQSSDLIPREDEVVPFFVVRYIAIDFDFYKNYVDLPSGPWRQGKPDLSFYILAWPNKLSNVNSTLQLNLNSGELEVWGRSAELEEKKWQSSGRIAAIPDLSRALLIVRIESMTIVPSLDPKDPKVAKVAGLRKMIKIKRIRLRIGPREFWLNHDQFSCKDDIYGEHYCAFIFPADLNTLRNDHRF